jgi:hypothetical protein
VTRNSNALQYLRKECPSLLIGTVQDRVHALRSWIELHQGQSRVAIYERIAMALALDLVFSTNKNLIVALSSNPVRRDEEIEPIRVFVEAVNLCGASPDRTRRQRISRDVRATRYLLRNGISPDKVCSLAQLSGEGVHAWAKKSAEKRKMDQVSRRPNWADGVKAPAKRRKAEITMRIGRGEMRSYVFWLENKDIDILKEMLKRMELKSSAPRVRRKRSETFVPRSERVSSEGAFDDPEFNEFLDSVREAMKKNGRPY